MSTTVLLIATSLAATSVQAQDAGAESTVDEIVITGSHIARTGFSAPTPVTTMTTQDVQLAGATNVGQLAFQMPQMVATQSAFVANSATSPAGTSFNLRGLGNTRTLTLIDGRRHVPSTNLETFDASAIPAGIIERVEVVTGGASAAYGSDAVAGVVNIILRKNIDGLEGSIQGGQSFHADARELKATLNYGTTFADGRGRVLAAGEISENDGILSQGSRSWGRGDWGIVNNPTYVPGSGQTMRVITRDARIGNATNGGLILSGVLRGTEFLPGGVPDRFDPGLYPLGSSNTIGGDGPNYGESFSILVPLKRQSFLARVSYDVTDSLSAFVEASYAKVIGSSANIAVMETRGSSALTIQRDNAFLPEQLRGAMLAAGETSFTMGRMNTEFPRYKGVDHNISKHFTVGFNGRLLSDWTWDAFYSYGENDIRKDTNDLNLGRLRLAVDAVRNAQGQIVCRSSLTAPTNGCVPINLFGEGAPSSQAVAYVMDDYPFWQRWDQHEAAFSVQGEPFSLWAGPVSVAAGAEYHEREYRRENTTAAGRATPHLFTTYENVVASYNVKEAFAETVVPLLGDHAFARKVEFNGAVRITDHSFSGQVVTWKAGLSYELNDELRFRLTRSRDIRSPNISEFAITPIAQIPVVRDINGAVLSVRNPIPPNPNLEPEKADTWTGGVVYQPSWAEGLRASIDYYDINVKGAISSLTAQQTIDGCGQGSQALCGQLQRDSAGVLVQVTSGLFNASSLQVSGVDFEVSYSVPADVIFANLEGRFSARLVATHTAKNSTNLLGVVTRTAGVTIPEWRATAHATYENDRLTARLTGQFVDGVRYDASYGPQDININEFSSRFYLNAAFQYALSEELQLFGNVDNILNVDPPIIPGQVTRSAPALSRYSLYDPIGTRFTVGLRFKLP